MTSFVIADASHRQFVVSGWSSSLRTSDRAGLIAMDMWSDVMHPQIERVLDRPSAVTVVALDKATGVLQGFVCADRTPGLSLGEGTRGGLPIVFYVYVKEPYRRGGVARGLFASVLIDPMLPFTYACRTSVVGRLRDKIPHARHDHLRARYPEGARP